MPYSSEEGKEFVSDFFHEIPLKKVIDIGVGAGAYRNVLAGHDAHWTGIEVWTPYIAQFDLEGRYDKVIVADARYMDWGKVGTGFDAVILGDVLEHMTFDEARRLLAESARNGRYVVVSLPVIHYPQGAELGNPWETHVEHYHDGRVAQLLDGYKVEAQYIGEVTGTFVVSGT